jgi:hypothetical protein
VGVAKSDSGLSRPTRAAFPMERAGAGHAPQLVQHLFRIPDARGPHGTAVVCHAGGCACRVRRVVISARIIRPRLQTIQENGTWRSSAPHPPRTSLLAHNLGD